MESLVTTEWLARELGAPDLRVIDASYFLPEHGRDAAAEYDAGHIPGAVPLRFADVSDKSTSLPSMLPADAQFGEALGALGVGDGDRIVVYDNSPIRTAARGWWMLRTFGAGRVAILDGGLAKWVVEGRPLETGRATVAPASFRASSDRAGVRTLAAMRANVESGAEQVADARSPGRFAGSEPETRPGLEAGHIPGSRNLPYGSFFQPDGTWMRGTELRAVFEAKGIDPGRPLVATCGSGITAAVIVFAAHLLGHPAALYDGSWTEWGSDASTPKAKGAA